MLTILRLLPVLILQGSSGFVFGESATQPRSDVETLCYKDPAQVSKTLKTIFPNIQNHCPTCKLDELEKILIDYNQSKEINKPVPSCADRKPSLPKSQTPKFGAEKEWTKAGPVDTDFLKKLTGGGPCAVYLAHFSMGPSQLSYLGIAHIQNNQSNKEVSAILDPIAKEFTDFKSDTVIVEGVMGHLSCIHAVDLYIEPTSRENESQFVAKLAVLNQKTIIGGEPSCSRIPPQDHFGIDTLRFMMILHHQHQNWAEKELFDQAIKLPVRPPPFNFAKFQKWYLKTNGTKLNLDNLDRDLAPESVIHDGFAKETNKIVEQEDLDRNNNILLEIRAQLEANKKVMVVYGGGHISTQAKVIESVFNKKFIEAGSCVSRFPQVQSAGGPPSHH